MRNSLCLILMLLPAGLAFSQKLDSVNLSKPKHAADSLEQKANERLNTYQSPLDSLNSLANLTRFKDSLKIQSWSDSLKGRINAKFSAKGISRSIDSLQSLSTPPQRLSYFSDSLVRRKETLVAEVNNKQADLQKRVSSRYDRWAQSVRGKFNLDSTGVAVSKIPGANLPTIADPLQGVPKTIPGISVKPDANVPALPGAELPASPGLNTSDFAALGMSSELTAVGGDLAIPSTDQLNGLNKSLPSMPDPLKEISGKAAELKAIKQDPGVAVEGAVGGLADVNAATQQLQQGEQLLQNNEALQLAEQMKNPDAVPETLQREALNPV